jgi:hypothetical protein
MWDANINVLKAEIFSTKNCIPFSELCNFHGNRMAIAHSLPAMLSYTPVIQ